MKMMKTPRLFVMALAVLAPAVAAPGQVNESINVRRVYPSNIGRAARLLAVGQPTQPNYQILDRLRRQLARQAIQSRPAAACTNIPTRSSVQIGNPPSLIVIFPPMLNVPNTGAASPISVSNSGLPSDYNNYINSEVNTRINILPPGGSDNYIYNQVGLNVEINSPGNSQNYINHVVNTDIAIASSGGINYINNAVNTDITINTNTQ